MVKPDVSDKTLSSIVDKLYRPNATIGSGSTAAAVRQELITTKPIGGVFHSQKASDSITELRKRPLNDAIEFQYKAVRV